MQVCNLTKYFGGKKVVDNVSFTLPKGKVISFIGPNGAGKSTVFNMLTNLIERDLGEIIFEGQDLFLWKRKALATRLAILSQTNTIYSKITVRELVEFGRFPYCGGKLKNEDHRLVDEALDFIELTDLQDCYLDEISGGQRQRALIAMVLAQDTDYIFLDEPTNNLDVYHATKLMKTLRLMCDKKGKTIVMVLHEINYASFYSDYICAFKDGKVAKFATVNEVMQKDFLKSIYNVDFEINMINNKPLSIHY